MEESLIQLENEFEGSIAQVNSEEALETLRIDFLGRKGRLSEIFKNIAQVSPDEKPILGKKINELKNKIVQNIDEKAKLLKEKVKKEPGFQKNYDFDASLPAIYSETGSLHPLTIIIGEICDLFIEMGFMVADGPEIETEYYNFEALNIALEHPSRDAFDTFYLENRYLLRSHTSPVQIRVMTEKKPPIQIVVPGKVYRPDAIDASHSYMFHQIEGFLVDKGITFSHLKGVLTVFAKKLFGEKIKMRFRPHFFPFTEPSAEVDISCIICAGKGCRVCGYKGWLEILGSGMVHPNVFKSVKINSKIYSGFAFGMGIERIAMLKYGIDDIRLFFENDMRFIKQFK